MFSWSSRRKILYAGSIFIIFFAIVFSISFHYLYKAPTCFDRLKNGDEQGVDCGGSCIKLCQSAYLPPVISWGGGKFEKVADGLYNLASYIVNPNTNAAAVNVPYKFSLFDNQGTLIVERQGKLTLPAHRNVLAFETAVNTGKRIPAKAIFEFIAPPVWFKSHDTLDGLAILDKKYSEDTKNSSLEVTLKNRSLVPYTNIMVNAILYDAESNAIGFSKTSIDSISPNGGEEIAPFTWPAGRNGEVISIEILPENNPIRD